MNADLDYPLSDLTGRIIQIFYEVYNELGFGFLEAVYENALAIALQDAGLAVRRQVPYEVRFRGQSVGEYRVDLLIADTVIVETKAVTQLLSIHETQLVNYLRVTGLEIGLLLNFGPKPEMKRKIFSWKNLRPSA